MRKYQIIVAFALCLVIVLAGAAYSTTRPKRLCIIDFASVGAATDNYWLGSFIASSLSKNLGVIPQIKIVREMGSRANVRRDEPLDEANLAPLCASAREAGADYIIGGEFREEGGLVTVGAYCVSTDAQRRVGGASFSSTIPDLYSRLAEMSILLAGSLDAEYSEAQAARVWRIPTDSPAAMVSYGRALMSPPLSDDHVTHLGKALSEDPQYTDALARLGIHYYQAGKYADSLLVLVELAGIQNDYPHLYYNLGLVYRAKKKYARAIEMYQKVLEAEPEDSDAWNNLGATYYLSGMRDEATHAFERALEIDPGDSNARANLWAFSKKYRSATVDSLRTHIEAGAALYASGDYWRAEEQLKSALAIDPRNFKANNNIALTYLKLGRNDLAKLHFERALEADPAATGVEENLAKLAVEAVRSEIVKDESPPAMKAELDIIRKTHSLCAAGSVYLSRGSAEQAVGVYPRAREISPESMEALIGLGSACFELGEYEGARQSFSEALALEPENLVAMEKLAEAQYVLEAESGTSRPAGASRPGGGEVAGQTPAPAVEARGRRVRADRLYEAGSYEEAAGEYLRALDLGPASHETLNNLACAYFMLGRREEARSALKKAERLAEGGRVVPARMLIERNLDAIDAAQPSDGTETIVLELFQPDVGADDPAELRAAPFTD
jgi:tetratricopeptide (TPR) repeat protein